MQSVQSHSKVGQRISAQASPSPIRERTEVSPAADRKARFRAQQELVKKQEELDEAERAQAIWKGLMRSEGILNLSRKSRSRGRSSSQGGLDDDLGFGASSNRFDFNNKSIKRVRPGTAVSGNRDSVGSRGGDRSVSANRLDPVDEENPYSSRRPGSSKRTRDELRMRVDLEEKAERERDQAKQEARMAGYERLLNNNKDRLSASGSRDSVPSA